MNIKDTIADSIIRNHTICNDVLHHTNESREAKFERFISLCNKLINVA